MMDGRRSPRGSACLLAHVLDLALPHLGGRREEAKERPAFYLVNFLKHSQYQKKYVFI